MRGLHPHRPTDPAPSPQADAALHRADPAEPWIEVIAATLDVPPELLRAFAQRMDAQQWPLDAARLYLDAGYAHARLALAHTSDDEALKQLALLLFDRYQALSRRRQAGAH